MSVETKTPLEERKEQDIRAQGEKLPSQYRRDSAIWGTDTAMNYWQ
jgi:hypothetical protein